MTLVNCEQVLASYDFECGGFAAGNRAGEGGDEEEEKLRKV